MKKKSLLIVAILTFVLSFAFAACGETTPDPEPTPTPAPHTHEYVTYTWVEGSVPSETADGKATAKCTGCDETTTVDVAKLTDDSVWTMTATAATCTEDGKKVYTSKYGTVEVAIPAEHTFGDLVAATDSTCLKKGNVAYYHCTVCEKNFAEDKTTELESVEKALADHVYGTLIEATTSTCVEHGTVEHYHCSVCGKNFDADKNVLDTIEAPLAAHTFGDLVAAVASTCQTHGNVAYYHCSVCEKNFAEDKTTVLETVEAPLGAHNYGELQKGDENGHFRACTTEGCTEKETVAHDYTGQAYYPYGTEEHYVNCTVCRYEHHERHEFGDWTKKDETNHAHKCAKCSKEITEAHTGGTATCMAKAVCTVCHEGYGNLADHVLGADGVCTVCGKTPNAVFGKTYSAFTVDRDGAVDTSVNALLTFDANGKAVGVTGSVGIIKKNGEYEDEGWYDTEYYKITDSSVYIRYVDKEKGTIQFVSSYYKATKYSSYGKYGTPKLTETPYDGYISGTNGFIFIPQGYGSSIVLVPTDTAVTTADVVASAFNTSGKIFFKYTGTEAHSVYYDASKSPVVVAIDATVTDFDGQIVAPDAFATAKAMIVKDKAGNVIAKYGYDGTQVVELDDWAGKYEGTDGTVTVWGTGKITTPYGEGDYVEVADKDYNIEVTYVNEDGDVIHYIEVKANKENKTYESSEPSIDVTYDLGDYGTTYTNTQGKKVTFTLPAAPTPTNEAYMFSGWSIGGDVYKQPGDKVAFEANTTVTAIWQMKVKITVVDAKNAANNKYFYAGADENLLEAIAKNTTTVLDGEEFKYWTIEVAGEPTEVGPDDTVGEDALTVTAVWKVKYTLTIVYGNGLANATETYFEGYATNPEKPAFTNGQVFDGWFTDAAFGTAYTPAVLTDNLTIYAKWKVGLPMTGKSYGIYVSTGSGYNPITAYGSDRNGYNYDVDANGVVLSGSTTNIGKTFVLNDDNTLTIGKDAGKYYPEYNAFAVSSAWTSEKRSIYIYFIGATETSVSTNAYYYHAGKYVFIRASVTRDGVTNDINIFVNGSECYFDVVVERGMTSGGVINYTEITDFSSMSLPDAIRVYNSDKSVVIAKFKKSKYNIYEEDGLDGEYVATVDGAASEDNVVLDGIGNITFGSLTGTYALNAEKTAYDVYLNSKKVYYSMTVDFEAKTATLVKEMVTISFDLNTVSGVDMGTFASVSVNKNVSASLSEYKPTKSGYVFKGWYTTAELTTSASSVTPTENVTVYAKWAKVCTVSFTTEYGTAPASTGIEQDQWFDINDYVLEDTEDYAFYGWYVEGYKDNAIITGRYKVSADTTFIAVWKAKVTLTIKYLADETEVITAKTVKIAVDRAFDLSAYKPTDEERGNYVFRSFYKEGDEAMAAITSITVADGETATVVAKMEAGITFTVKYQDNKVADKAYVVGSGDTLDLGAAKAATYADGADTFFVEGLYTDNTYATAFTATSITENTIVYAKWVKAGTYTMVSGGDKKGFDYNAEKGCWVSNNAGVNSSSATLTITAVDGPVLVTFSYACGGEGSYAHYVNNSGSGSQWWDYLIVKKGTTEIVKYKQGKDATEATLKVEGPITVKLNAGETLEFTYQKDSSTAGKYGYAHVVDLTVNGAEAELTA